MAECRVLAVGCNAFLHGGYGPVPYVEASVKAIAEALAPSPAFLIGQHCTKALLESRVRQLKQSAKTGDTLIFIVRGQGILSNGANRFASEIEERWLGMR